MSVKNGVNVEQPGQASETITDETEPVLGERTASNAVELLLAAFRTRIEATSPLLNSLTNAVSLQPKPDFVAGTRGDSR